MCKEHKIWGGGGFIMCDFLRWHAAWGYHLTSARNYWPLSVEGTTYHIPDFGSQGCSSCLFIQLPIPTGDVSSMGMYGNPLLDSKATHFNLSYLLETPSEHQFAPLSHWRCNVNQI